MVTSILLKPGASGDAPILYQLPSGPLPFIAEIHETENRELPCEVRFIPATERSEQDKEVSDLFVNLIVRNYTNRAFTTCWGTERFHQGAYINPRESRRIKVSASHTSHFSLIEEEPPEVKLHSDSNSARGFWETAKVVALIFWDYIVSAFTACVS